MIKVGIFGAGIMGTNHARIASMFREAEVAAIVDPDEERGATLATAYGTKWLPRIESRPEFDLAILAVPTELHHPLGRSLIEWGVPTLIEKPLAESVELARELVELAYKASVPVAVGHVERFNPAVMELENLVGEVLHIDFARLSPHAPRVTEGVIRDLMIHDLDIARHLMGKAASVQAVARKVLSETEDLASALLTFEAGGMATLTASRISQNKVRTLQISQQGSFINVDLLQQAITIHRVEHAEYLSSKGTRYRQNGLIEIPYLEHRGEPLALQFEDILAAVGEGRPPRVPAADGLEALVLVERVSKAAGIEM